VAQAAWACGRACVPISPGISLVRSSAEVQITYLTRLGAGAGVYRASLRYVSGKDVFSAIKVCLFSAICVKAGLQCCAVSRAAHQQLATKAATAACFATLGL